jgi:hypothetical protein
MEKLLDGKMACIVLEQKAETGKCEYIFRSIWQVTPVGIAGHLYKK